MADVLVNALTPIVTEPISTDSIVCVNRSTNEGQIIDYELLAGKILDKLTSKTFSGLNTTSKLITGAINELDADTYSLGVGTAIPENSDLNNYIAKGKYYCAGSAIASTLSNLPDGFAAGFSLIVEKITVSNDTGARQLIIPAYYGSAFMYERKRSSSTWGEWTKYSGSKDIPFAIKNYSYVYTVSANSGLSITGNNFGISTPSGYAPLAIRSINTGVDVVLPRISAANAAGNSAVVRLYNVSSAQQSGTCEVTIVYVASAWFNGTPLT